MFTGLKKKFSSEKMAVAFSIVEKFYRFVANNGICFQYHIFEKILVAKNVVVAFSIIHIELAEFHYHTCKAQ